MIRRLLIANRGEIAIRIIRACRELDIETVAVYSEADRAAAHVAAADRAVAIGPAAPTESYLAIDRIVAAAKTTNADGIHPGYGFLSENRRFADACERAGIVFVGPPAAVLALTGNKIAARETVTSAGVPVVPGTTPGDQSDAGIRRAIDEIGFPALIKAASGGGGKGMREVRDANDLDAHIQGARREAQSAFGNGTLYVERRISRPHHVEVQIVGDAHGQVVHVFERECSTQRRHQKIIEESPSPNVTPGLRARITDAAVAAARAAGYRNAGTCEFLVDLSAGRQDTAPFYFLEMNSRLQVEHGVTEAVAGVDLVHAQLRVASGEPLPWKQDQLTQRGHAIEARIYAEDPAHDFLPQAGRLLLYRAPQIPGVRIDSGYREGDEVPLHYDPLVAKVVAAAETREQAIARLSEALRAFPLLGITTNVAFLLRILGDSRFHAGTIDTAFLDGPGRELCSEPAEPTPPAVSAALSAASGMPSPAATPAAGAEWDPWRQPSGWRG